MRESTATTTRRGPNAAVASRDHGGRDGATRFATQGATALAPERRPGTGEQRVAEKARLRVAPPAPVTVPRAPFVALVLVVVVAGVLGILLLNTKINENAFRLANLHDQQSSLDQQEQQLSQQLARDESPNSLAAAALRLGLVQAGTPAYIQMPDGRVLGVPQPATGAQSVTARQTGASSPGR